MQANVGRLTYEREIRWVLQVAMAVFLVTVAIGLLNGMKLVQFTRDQLLTHLHSGTLGWITLGVLAASLWLFGGAAGVRRASSRWLAILFAVAIPCYVAAFWSGTCPRARSPVLRSSSASSGCSCGSRPSARASASVASAPPSSARSPR